MKKFAVCCLNERELDDVLKKFNDMGARWCAGESALCFKPSDGGFPKWIHCDDYGDTSKLSWGSSITNGFEAIDYHSFVGHKYLITIYSYGSEIIAESMISGKKARVTCFEGDDEKDFIEGAIFALKKLIEGKDTFPHLVNDFGNFYGNIGAPTDLLYSFGRPLCVGDVVYLIDKDGISREAQFVVSCVDGEDYTHNFVMGIECMCKGGMDYNDEFLVVKTKSYKDLQHQENYGFVTAIIE